MAITHVNTQTASQASNTSVTVNKPSGLGDGDILFAIFASNAQNCTPPSGFIEISDQTEDVFRQQVFYKVAGSGEPSNYTFSVSADAPLIVTLSAFRGVDTSDPIDIDLVAEATTTHSEPYTTPTISGGTAGLLLYGRSARISSSTPATYTASGVTERVDAGIFSGGSVSYSTALYTATSEYTSGGSKSGVGITASGSESHNVVFTVALKSSGIPGSMVVQMPSLPTVSIAGSQALPATLEATMPLPTMSASVFHGSYEGPLAVEVPITVTIAAATATAGTLDVDVPILFDLGGETRSFAENVVTPEREERWLIITQEGERLGVRNVTHLPLIIVMPLPEVLFIGNASPLAPDGHVAVEVGNASTTKATTVGGTGTVTAAVTANAATVERGAAPPVGTASPAVTVNQPTVSKAVAASAGHVTALVAAEGINLDEMVEILAFAATVTTNSGNFTFAPAGHASVTCNNP